MAHDARIRQPVAKARAGAPIEIAGVTKCYATARGGEVHALAEIDLSIAAGEFVSVVGPSGCGKSTLLMLISGLIAPTSGAITVGGAPVKRAIGNVAIVFQRDVLLDWRTVLANVLLPVEIKKLDPATHRSKARELLRSVGLEGFEDKYPAELSGGMRQRVAICRALVQEPVVMSSRPGRIADVVQNDLPRPRGAHTRSEPRFVEHVERIRQHFLALGVLSET
jgi:NitT/TauT family transport system ATP-binding protein